MFKMYKGLPKDAYILFSANVINRIGDFVNLFLALYLTTKLGFNTKETSLVVTLAMVSRVPAGFIGGYFADYFSRKNTYLIAQFLAGLTLFPCALFEDASLIVTLLICSTFFNGAARPALDALIIDLMPKNRIESGISLMYLGINIGVAIGPAIAGFLFEINMPLFFLVDALTSLTAVLLVFLWVREDKSIKIDHKNLQTPRKKFTLFNAARSLVYLNHKCFASASECSKEKE